MYSWHLVSVLQVLQPNPRGILGLVRFHRHRKLPALEPLESECLPNSQNDLR